MSTLPFGQSQYYWPILTSTDWSRGIFVHEYGDELEGWEKWFCDTHDWSKFTGASGAVTLVTIGPGSIVAAFSRTSARGVPASANYAQKTFSKEGKFAGKTVDILAADIRAGRISPKDVPIEIAVTGNGNTLILNTRSAQALTKAGIPRSRWNAIVINEYLESMERLAGQLSRNNLSLDGFAYPINGQ